MKKYNYAIIYNSYEFIEKLKGNLQDFLDEKEYIEKQIKSVFYIIQKDDLCINISI